MMPRQPLEAGGNYCSLVNYPYAFGDEACNTVGYQRIVCAAENEGIYIVVFGKYTVDVFFYEIIGSGSEVFVVLYQWYPHRALLWHYFYVGEQFFYFYLVRLRPYSTCCAEYAYRIRFCQTSDALGSGAYYSEDTPIGCDKRQVVLLYRP